MSPRRLFGRVADAVWEWAWAEVFAILNRASGRGQQLHG